jgi:uncharacterized protein YfiM (DUF2279 family)
MKKVLVVFAFLFSFISETKALEKDKQMHLAASAVLTASGYTVCRISTDMSKTACVITSALTVFGIGVLKELGDSKHNNLKEHAKDVGANTLGIGLGLGVSILW